MHMCVSQLECMCTVCVQEPMEVRRGCLIPATGVTGGYELSSVGAGCEIYTAPMQEPCVSYIAEPSLQPPFIYF